MNAWESPFVVPVAGCLVGMVAIVSGAMGQAHARRVKADQRMAMLQRGMTIEQIDAVLNSAQEPDEQVRTKDPLRSLGCARRAGIVLVSVGVGLIVFGFLLTAILRVHQVLTVSASGLIPLAIGIGFFVDYTLQKRELSRFGLEVGAELPPGRRS
jgi:hypothetical protein